MELWVHEFAQETARPLMIQQEQFDLFTYIAFRAGRGPKRCPFSRRALQDFIKQSLRTLQFVSCDFHSREYYPRWFDRFYSGLSQRIPDFCVASVLASSEK